MLSVPAAVVVHLLIVLCQQCDGQQPTYEVVTSPTRLSGQDKVIVPAEIGEENITVSCSIYFTQNGVINNVEDYDWKLINGSTNTEQNLSFDTETGFSNETSFLTANYYGSVIRNITISEFRANMDRMSLVCSAVNVSATFLFGILNPPTLTSSVFVNVSEGNNFTVDLARSDNNPFPPYINLSLTYSGQALQYPNIFVTNNFTVEGVSVWRNQSGVYQFVASNDAGSNSTSFNLNVQFQPEGDNADTIVYASIGKTVNLTSFRNLNGNPSPSTVWYDINNVQISSTNVNYTIHSTVLTIVNIMIGMFGNYTFTAFNGIGSTLTAHIQVVEAILPGAPTNVSVTSITSESATINWTAPSNIGVPQFSHYVISISPSIQGPFMTSQTVIVLSDLLPVILYNVTVSTVSSVFTVGIGTSVTFTTTNGPPKIDRSIFSSRNGSITIDWSLRHTGGIGLTEVSIKAFCSVDMDFALGSGSGSGSGISPDSSYFLYTCGMQCVSSDLDGLVMLGRVTAGTRYYCTFQAANSFGVDSRVENVVSSTGKPSKPIVAVLKGSIITVVCSSEYGGSNIVMFMVTVTATDNQAPLFKESYISQNYNDGNNITINTNISTNGIYYVTVVAENLYGLSDMTQVGPIDFMAATSEPTTGSTGIQYVLIIIIAASVGGLLLAVFVIGICICVCACCYRKRKTQTVQFETTRSQTWKRTDNIEMSQRMRFNS